MSMNTNILSLDTDRLLIRRYEDKDVNDILEYSLNADFWLARNLSWKPTKEAIKAYYEPMKEFSIESFPKWLDFVIDHKTDNKVIGCVGIGFAHNEQKQAMIGCALGRNYQGRGLATEALKALVNFGFFQLGLHRIFARTGSLNIASWSLMERVGMRREAHFIKSHTVKGKWDDEFIYAILSDEWIESHS
jgi:RimJ/RimL family protein N-acetyltransferase